jgi:hypothetical protein
MTKFYASPPVTKTAPVHISQKVPVYKLLRPYFDKQDCLIPEGEIIQLKTEPNQYMEPMNSLAKEEMVKLLTKIDNIALGKVESVKPLSLLEKYEKEKALKAHTVDDSDELEGSVAALSTFNNEPTKSILGARKIKVGEDEYVVDKREADKIIKGKKKMGRPVTASKIPHAEKLVDTAGDLA